MKWTDDEGGLLFGDSSVTCSLGGWGGERGGWLEENFCKILEEVALEGIPLVEFLQVGKRCS